MSERIGIVREPFGSLVDGQAIERVRLRASSGFEASILTYGATLHSLSVPDRDGRFADVLLGHDDLAGYVATRGFYGATIGRYANRLAGGAFELDGAPIQIQPNNGPNALHGGAEGFDRRVWAIAEEGGEADPFVTLARVSPDGECGYPGTLDVRVTYRLVGDAALEIAYEATTDKTTVVNLTNHSFFNLGGTERVTDVLGHRLTIVADAYLPIDATSIPEGGPAAVDGTPFDFRTAREIGEAIRQSDEQIHRGRGYDHNFCLDGGVFDKPRLAARVEDSASGRVMELWTDQPGVQFYSGNFLDGTLQGKHGVTYRMGDAFCLEPQLYPDTPNRPDFPSARLDPGETYRHGSIYRFSTN